jgi:hypothetical protein
MIFTLFSGPFLEFLHASMKSLNNSENPSNNQLSSCRLLVLKIVPKSGYDIITCENRPMTAKERNSEASFGTISKKQAEI